MSLEEKFQIIHQQALEAAKAYRRAEAGLIEALIAVEGARKAREVPRLMEAIREGSASISKAKKIVSVLTPENQEEWIEKARTLSSRKIEKEVAREDPKEAAPERASYVSEKRLALSLGVSEELMLQLRRAQDQVSQARGRAATLEETLEEMAGFFLKHKDPVEKARRVIAKKGGAKAPAQGSKQESNCSREQSRGTESRARRPIPAALLHAIRLRDQGLCQHRRSDGTRCGEKRWVDLHHLVPVSRGGTDSVENLLTLCRTHHGLVHVRG